MEQGVIYKVVNKVNGKVYIGQTINFINRKKQHIYKALKNNDNNLFYNALRSYGIDLFEWDIIWSGDSTLLDEMEIYFIKGLKAHRFSKEYDGINGYNMTIGGGTVTGYHHTKETKAKIKGASTGRPKTDNFTEKVRLSNNNRIWSDNSRVKVSEANKGKLRGSNNPAYNSSIFTFVNKDGREFIGTMYDFRTYFNFKRTSVNGIIKDGKTLFGWRVIK